jgi:hypothetical protein
LTASPSPDDSPRQDRTVQQAAEEPHTDGPRHLDAAVLALVALHLSITVPLARALNVWTDEAYSLHTTSAGVGHALRSAVSFELQPPAYFVVLAAWRAIDPSPTFARMLSVLFAAATLLILAPLARRLLPAPGAPLVVAAAALNPFLVWAAVEIRAYAMIVLLSALVMLLFAEVFLAPDPRPRPTGVAAMAAAAAALVYTQYYGALLLTAGAAALAAARRWRALASYLISMAAVLVLVSPLALSLPASPATGDAGPLGSRVVSAAGQMLHRLEEYLIPVVTLLDSGKTASGRSTVAELGLKLAFVGAFAAAVAGSAAVRRFLMTDRGLASVVTTAALALQFAALMAWVGPLYVDTRHTAALFVPALACSAAVFAAIPSRLALAGWLAVSLGASIPRLVADYRPLAKPGDLARVARFLAAREQPGEPVFVFPCENVLGLRFHYEGRNALVPIPREPSLVEYDPRTFAVENAGDVERALASRPRRAGHAWLVLEPSRSHMGVPNGREIVEAYVQKRCVVESEERFERGTRVLYLTGC